MTRRGAALSLALIAALAIALWRPGDAGGFFGAIEGRLLDIRFALRGERSPPAEVVIIGVDDADIATLGRFPPPRAALAKAVDAAATEGALAVALDLLLVEPTGDDSRLAAALANAPNAVLAVASAPAATSSSHEFAAALERGAFPMVRDPPTAVEGSLAAVGPDATLAPHAALGHVNVVRGADGALRRMPVALRLDGGGGPIWLPSLAVAAIMPMLGGSPRLEFGLGAARLATGDRTVPLDARGAALPWFYGPRGTIETHPLRRAATAPLAGRIVFIGAIATGYGDTFASPFDDELPGVEAHATLAANLLEGAVLRRDGATWAADAALAAVFSLAMFGAAARETPALAATASALVFVAAAAAAQSAFLGGWALDGVTLGLALAAGGTSGFGLRLIEHRRRAANLARYQSPLMAEILATTPRPDFDRRLQQAAALFVDAAGFTARAEALGPRGAAALMRRLHETIERAATAHRGVVVQFAGDGALVAFGLPQPSPDDAARALRCVESLFAAFDAEAETWSGVSIRAGVHFGEVEAAILGGRAQRHVDIAGDVVNAASRLQELARDEGAAIAVSDAALRASGDAGRWAATLRLRKLGARALRRRSAPLDVWAGGPPRAGA